MGKDPGMVHPITTAALLPPRPAKRPANSVLDNKALRDAGYAPTRDFREPLAELLRLL
jgi:dTDP-4-dehydrorhamnose reductase